MKTKFSAIWNKFWFEPRSPVPLALFRIVFCLFILETTYHFACDFDLIYSVHGMTATEDVAVFSNWGMLPRLDLWAAFPDQPWWPHLLFAIQEVCVVSLIVGFCTRASALMVMFFLISTHTHVPILWCCSDRFEIVMLLLMSMSNAGDAFSVDALIEHRGDWHKAGFGAPKKPGWAMRMMQVQLAAVYFHTTVCKLGYSRWWDSSIMYYTARWHELEKMPVPSFLYDTVWGCQLQTYSALLIEFSLWTLIWVKRWRYWVLFAGLLFHLMIDWMANLPDFEGLFIAAYILFIDADDLERWWGKLCSLFAGKTKKGTVSQS